MFDFLFWNTSKCFGFVPIISFDIGTFVLPFWYRWHYYCVGWSVWLLGHILACLLCSCRELNLPGMPTVLTRVCCLSLKQDMDREVCSHPDSRISAKVLSWELGLSRVLRPDDHRNHPELRYVSSLHYRLHHQSCQRHQSCQMRHQSCQKLTCKWTLRQVFICLRPLPS